MLFAESDGNSNNMTKHVAAWDLPSLDYLSEEQTLKYLRHGCQMKITRFLDCKCLALQA